MATFIYNGTEMVNKATGEPMLSAADRAKPPQTPMVQEFKAYSCPITGKDITDPSMHKANLKAHNCGEIKNHAFAKKRGLTVSDKYMDTPNLAKGIA